MLFGRLFCSRQAICPKKECTYFGVISVLRRASRRTGELRKAPKMTFLEMLMILTCEEYVEAIKDIRERTKSINDVICKDDDTAAAAAHTGVSSDE